MKTQAKPEHTLVVALAASMLVLERFYSGLMQGLTRNYGSIFSVSCEGY